MMRTGLCGLMLLIAVVGCIPNKLAVSPDGKTVYFALGSEGEAAPKEESAIYAFDLERCRLKTLSKGEGWRIWCSLTPDGERLYFMTDGRTEALDTKTGAPVPLKGMGENAILPFIVPGDSPLILTLHPKGPEGLPAWRLHDGKGLDRKLLPEYAPVICRPALGKNRAALAVQRQFGQDNDGDDLWELCVFVIDLADPKKPEVRRVARWVSDEDSEPGVAWLDFSPDGTQLLVMHDLGDAAGTYLVNLKDVGAPKRMMEKVEGDVYHGRFAPDGKGIICLISPDGDESAGLYCFAADGGKPALLLALGKHGAHFFPTWRALGEKRLRIHAVSDQGLRLVDVDLDGKNRVEKHLTHERLKRQQELADLEFRLRAAPAMDAGADRDAELAKIARALGNPDDLDKALEAEFDTVDEWEK